MSPLSTRQYRPAQASRDQHAFIPGSVEQAMTKQMQQSLPAHLKRYASGESGYIPQHVEQQLTQHMQKTLPKHMRQYAGAYVQQNIVTPSIMGTAKPSTPAELTARPPVPNLARQDHSNVSASQYDAQFHNLFTPDNANQPSQPSQPAPVQPYDFIMNPQPAATTGSGGLPGSNSMLKRLAVVGGLLVVLLIAFTVIKGVLSGGSALPAYVSLAQEQQELIHLTDNVAQVPGISTDNKNFAATANLSLSSSQSGLLAYLQTNHQKVDAKLLNLKISKTTDDQLTTAEAATTYNQTFQEIMKTKMTDYVSHLQSTYNQSTGKKGRALLNDNYGQAQLLLTQLKQASTTN
jgi:hypothetical protein